MLAGNQNPNISMSTTASIKQTLASGGAVTSGGSLGATASTGIPTMDYQTLNVLNATNEILTAANSLSERLNVVESTYMTSDPSSIVKESLYISSAAEVPFIELSKTIKGDPISMVVHMDNEDLVLDASYNQYLSDYGKVRLEIPTSLVADAVGHYCSIVYLV